MDEKTSVEHYDAILQDLWPRYLALLDRYTRAQAEIARLYSSATFSLARANFANSTKTRYGRTHFDQRMIAATTAIVSTSPITDQPTVSVHSSLSGAPLGKVTSASNEATLEADESEKPGDDGGEGAPATRPVDRQNPLRWFGVLVPRELRQCQADFLRLSTGPVPEAVAAATEMRALEREIRRVRKARSKSTKIQTS